MPLPASAGFAPEPHQHFDVELVGRLLPSEVGASELRVDHPGAARFDLLERRFETGAGRRQLAAG